MKRCILPIALFLLTFTQKAQSTQTDEYFKSVLEDAGRGVPNAIYTASQFYKYGWGGVEINIDKHQQLFQQALDAQSSHALSEEGVLNFQTLRGIEFLKKAAEQKHAYAIYVLAELYRTGKSPALEKDLDIYLDLLQALSNDDLDTFKLQHAKSVSLYNLHIFYKSLGNNEKALRYLDKLAELHKDTPADIFHYSTPLPVLVAGATLKIPEALYWLASKYSFGLQANQNLDDFSILESAPDQNLLKSDTLSMQYYKLAADRDLPVANYIYALRLIDKQSYDSEIWARAYEIERYLTRAIELNYNPPDDLLESAAQILMSKGKYKIRTNWGDSVSRKLVLTEYTTESFLDVLFYAEITSFTDNTKGIAFITREQKKDICIPSTNIEEVWVFDSQPVRMKVKCHKDEGDYYFSKEAFPLTKAGMDFVINRFKSSTDTVTVKLSTYEVPMSSIGFTKIWEAENIKAI